ncbi:MAG: PRC-barrel domain-containing protein [Pyrinomonadaceae bacterium]
MDIKINSEVLCEGEKAGQVTCVIVDTAQERITHLVVQEKEFPFTEKIVNLTKVKAADKERVELNCTAKDLHEMEDFVKTAFSPIQTDVLGYTRDDVVLPYSNVIEVGWEQTPVGETPIRQGAKVFATDGEVGEIDDFLTAADTSGKVSHIVLKEGHFWDLKNITIPVDAVTKVDDNGIYLNLDKDAIGELPSVKAHNWFG